MCETIQERRVRMDREGLLRRSAELRRQFWDRKAAEGRGEGDSLKPVEQGILWKH